MVFGNEYRSPSDTIRYSSVNNYCIAAFQEWQSAINQLGTIITFTKAGDWTTADIKIRFVDYSGTGLCAYGNNMQVSINHTNEARFSYTGAGIDLRTTILHELGHLIIYAAGHDTAGASSIMGITGCNPVNNPPSRRILHSLTTCDRQRVLQLYDTYNTVTIKNDFNGNDGGKIKVDADTLNSPVTKSWRISSFPHTLTAVDGQNISEGQKTYIRRFNRWRKDQSDFSINSSVQIDRGDGTYTASFRKEYNVTFQNDLPGSSSGGLITINGSQTSAPATRQVIQDTPIESYASIYWDIARIDYTFSHWTDELNNSYTNQILLQTPTDHKSFTAHYSAQPQQPANITANTGQTGSNLTLHWTAHPNPNVSYYIYRISALRNNGQPQLLATRANHYTSYTDNEFTVGTSGDYDVDNRYDIRSKFSVNNTYSPENYLIVKHLNHDVYIGEGNNAPVVKIGRLPEQYAVDNYPNPFNPSTKISYQIAAPSSVRIVVYDMMGRKVKELLNESRPAGYYDVTWDGNTERGINASSGIYFLYFTAHPGGKEMFSKSIELLLAK